MDKTTVETTDHPQSQLHRIKFSILLTFQVPAYILSLLIFAFFIKNTRLLSISHNQALLVLLVVNFIQLTITLPMNLHFYAVSAVVPSTPTFCQWWTFIEFSLYVTSEYLMATISVQRHMLVFNAHVMRVCWMRWLLYYSPLIFSLTYPGIFYLGAIIFYPCDGSQYDFTSNVCGFTPCYLLFNKVLGTFDWAVNNGVPMVINALANVLLVVRVIRHKRQQNRTVSWKQQRRMTVQLFWISSLYLIAWSPCLVVGLVQILGYPTFMASIQTSYFLDLIYVVCLFLPWVILGLLPELDNWLKSFCGLNRVRNVVSTTSTNLHTTHPTRVHPSPH